MDIRRRMLLKKNAIFNEGPINIDNYLTIEALEDGLTAKLSINACEYCVDGDGNWKSLAKGKTTESINAGQTLSFRGNLTPTSSKGIGKFTISKKCNLKGNCMSMLFGDAGKDNYSLSGKTYAFYKLFENCTTLKSVSANFLPATTLTYNCYESMFSGCTSLTTAPVLPATTLARHCYASMFSGCKSLITAPVLPATTLASYCYDSMFEGCISLTTAPELPATTLAQSCYDSMFQGCTSLTTAPELPATRLASSCYRWMFYGCTNLTTSTYLPATTLSDSCYDSMFHGTNVLPDCSNINFTSSTVVASGGLQGLFAGTKVTDNDLERILPKNSNGRYYLPVTRLARYSYSNMFQDCTSLTTAPELPATTLSDSCYYYMFIGCTSLTTAPELPATTLSDSCYYWMFSNCSSLTTAPVLPATTLAYSCYGGMFRGCSSLTTAPELPATTLASRCYSSMFLGCTSLTTAPELPATTLAERCYESMFQNCKKLNYIKMLATDISATNCLYYWVRNVASTGTFVKNPDMTTLPTGTSGIPSGWTVVNDGEESVNIDNYLTIEALEDGLTASLSVNTCEYCVDGDNNWKTLSADTATESVNAGQTLSFRGELTPVSGNGIGTFTISKKCNLKGNCMSMLFGDNAAYNFSLSGKNYAFYQLFYNCSNIVTVSSNFLPATTLSSHCYQHMFYGCTSLKTAPELPATTLESYCYYQMFYGCSSLTTAPELPATTLADSCYYNMFRGCTKLNYIKMLATNISATNCLYSWVLGVASSGTFVKNPAMTTLPTATLSNSYYGIPSGWTVVNDGEESVNIDNYLTIEALEDGLTASLSVNDCEYCVDGDGNWKSLAAGTATESINSGHTLSFRGELTPITAGTDQGIGKFTISKKCNLKGNCMSMLFGDNAVNNYSLSDKRSAFFELFYKCSNIVTVSSGFLPATTLSSNCYIHMFEGCKSLTTAPELPATTLASSCYKSMFEGCISLTTAPELPATTLADSCYSDMFYNCTSLINAPELPATTLASECYNNMFYGCTSLTTAPELPATTLAYSCYRWMFRGCKSLTTAPELPATTLAKCCYYYMFYGCTSLTTAPELPVTTLADSCYSNMFQYCSKLTTAPELPATTLKDYCYESMFYGCTSLKTAPELPATTLGSNCYRYMFYNCTNLNYIKMLATDISASNCLYNWVSGVASTGTFVKNPAMTSLPTGTSGIPSGWTVVNDVNTDNYLTIEALEDGLTASLSTNACEYCVDGDGKWKSLTAGTATESINSGQTLSFRGELTPITAGINQGIGKFTISKKCNLKGNCMSMLFGDNAVNNYSLSDKRSAFVKLFYNCSNIVTVSSGFLPATTLAIDCYYSMFYGCTSLTTAPELPATTLESSCYRYMFSDCTSLTTVPTILPATTLTNICYDSMFYGCKSLTIAPELPATALADYCYNSMFDGCTSLVTAPELPATSLTSSCYNNMFYGCKKLTTAPELPATTLAGSCYNGMFANCTNLTTAPELPATTLANQCYSSMFYGCKNLTTAPELPATALADYCYNSMFYGCKKLTTAPELPATTLADYCYGSMFYGCTSLTTAPELPATTHTQYCYRWMFYGCTKLNYIKMLATNISADYCLDDWVYNVASSGTFVKHPDMTTLPTGTSGIPSGWTVVNDGEESGGKIVNKGTITIGVKGYTITFDYPVTSDIRVVFDSLTVTIYTGSISGSLPVMPGEDPVFKGLSPNEDDVYIYKIDYE